MACNPQLKTDSGGPDADATCILVCPCCATATRSIFIRISSSFPSCLLCDGGPCQGTAACGEVRSTQGGIALRLSATHECPSSPSGMRRGAVQRPAGCAPCKKRFPRSSTTFEQIEQARWSCRGEVHQLISGSERSGQAVGDSTRLARPSDCGCSTWQRAPVASLDRVCPADRDRGSFRTWLPGPQVDTR